MAAEPGSRAMEKQTVQSGGGLESMKGISKAPVVLGTYGRPASNTWEGKPSAARSLRREAASAAAPRKHTGRIF